MPGRQGCFCGGKNVHTPVVVIRTSLAAGRRYILLGWILLVVCVWPARAALPTQNRLDAQLGWSGWVSLGSWIPLRVEIASTRSGDAAVEAEVPQAGRAAGMIFRAFVHLSPGVPQRITLPVFLTDPGRPVTVRLLDGNRELARQVVAAGGARVVEGVVLALTREPVGLEFLAGFSRKLRAAYIEEDDLPARWQDYSGVALLVIRDLNPARIRPAQEQAIAQWVLQGGHLLVTSGERLDVLRVPWLAALLPAIPIGLAGRQLAGLPEAVTGTSVTVRPGADVHPATGPPLSVRWRVGAGVVTLWTVDAFAPAVRVWPGRVALWDEALRARGAPAVAAPDLAYLLPGTSPLPGGAQTVLAVLSVLYIVAARAVLRRSGRVRYGWLGIPAVAAVFGLTLFGFGLQARRAGSSVVMLSVVDVIAETDRARVTGYVALVNPYGGTAALTAPPGAVLRPTDPAPLVLTDGGAAVSGTISAGSVRFELTQLLTFPLRGRTVQDADGVRVELDNRVQRTITHAVLYREGHRYRLPDVGPQLTMQLDPAKWEAVTRRPVPPQDLGDRLEEWVLARLQRQTRADTVWLVGRVRDPRLDVASPTARLRGAHHAVVVPLALTSSR